MEESKVNRKEKIEAGFGILILAAGVLSFFIGSYLDDLTYLTGSQLFTTLGIGFLIMCVIESRIPAAPRVSAAPDPNAQEGK